MNLQAIVQNELHEDESSLVWLLRGHDAFAYSDGAASERYLREVFLRAKDLSAGSSELEGYIKDWSSEYHLTTKRAQLLSGFKFDRSLKVLEVGCGCGAITRYLGETFDNVVSVEGSIARARLARLRTRDLDSVSVICAPFQDIHFTEKFDVVFVIGVFEYSASFVGGDDPYDAALRSFADMLTPNGMIVVAIENQFGLKYWNGCREDHLGTAFEGLEGYHRGGKGVRTFGKRELEMYIERYFRDIRFFYPYPDYKVPDCVLSGEFLHSGAGGELVSQLSSRDYSGFYRPLFHEAATILELSRNEALEFFSNSFLVLASKESLRGVRFEQLGCLYSPGRKAEFRTETRIFAQSHGEWIVSKRLKSGEGAAKNGLVSWVSTDSPWMLTKSLLTRVILQSKGGASALDQIFSPCRKWVELLVAESQVRDGVAFLGGSRIDSIWSNVYLDGSDLRFVDQEWVWANDIPLNVLVIRAIYDFLLRAEGVMGFSALLSGSGRALIKRIASAIGIKLTSNDFKEFIAMESEFQWIVSGASKVQQRFLWRIFLIDVSLLRFVVRLSRFLLRGKSRVMSVSSRLFSKLLSRMGRSASVMT